MGTPGAPPGGPSKLKGTMVGVAPPVPMPGTPAPLPAAFGGQPAFGVPPAPHDGGPPGGAAFNPTGQQVNPLGGTMVADNAPPYAPPQQQQPGQDPFGAPAGQQGYGGPPPGGNPYGGAPQQGYGGAPQQGYGGPPQQQDPFGGAPPQQGGYGGPPQQPSFPGAPQQNQGFGGGGQMNQGAGGAYGAPQQAYGQPPQQAPYGQPPQQAPYGQPPQPGYGDPQQQGYGAAPGAAQQMQQFGAQMNQGLAPLNQALAPAAGTKPTVRNALMTFLLPLIIMVGGTIVGTILAFIVASLGSAIIGLSYLAGGIVMLLSIIKMANEVKSVTNNASFAWWPIFIPVYSIYWMLILVPQEVTKAKQMVGLPQPARGIVLYFFIFLFALASDLNDIAKRQSGAA